MKLPSSTTLRLLSWFGVGLAAILLILTYTPLGISVNGNRNWLYLGSSLFSIQPAEFAKLAMIVWGADVLTRKYRLLDQPKHLLVPFLPVSALLILLVLFQGTRERRWSWRLSLPASCWWSAHHSACCWPWPRPVWRV